MQEIYNPKIIESRIQEKWYSTKAFKAEEDTSKKKFYCLSMSNQSRLQHNLKHFRKEFLSIFPKAEIKGFLIQADNLTSSDALSPRSPAHPMT